MIDHYRFLLAKLHMDAVSTKPLERHVRQASETLPSTLHQAYELSLSRIDEDSRDVAASTFLALFHGGLYERETYTNGACNTT